MTLIELCTTRGHTLIELVLAIVILSLVVPVLLTLSGSVTSRFYQGEALARAAQVAHILEVEVLSRRFDELLEKAGGNWSTTLGPDAGETGGAPSYDDVDDFHNFSQALSGAYAGYTRSASVTYAATDMGARSIVPSASAANPYKLITLRVVGPFGVDISYAVLATTANSQGAPAQ